ncbi:MAG TPA: recombinase family protein [Acidimicrobiales bacterium]|nr:recombinase family protein [Acidimicrobiales bacterium]
MARIFADYLAGNGLFAVAEGLTRDGIPSPSAHDPARNRHRDTRAWSKSAVLTLVYDPVQRLVTAEARPPEPCASVRVGGGT